jgi:MYXO-CTERM domain-containing protein
VNGCGKPGDKGILGMLKTDGTAWEYLTPFGEANSQIVVDTNDTAYVAGWGASGSVPIVGTVAQPTYAGGTSDAYVLKLDKLPNATVTGCAPCTGDVGSAGARPCTTGLPKCSVSGECIAASTCSVDGDCGNATSGRICEAKACVDGCRGTGGNGCAAPKVCSSTTATPGTCRDVVADAGPDAAPSDAGPDAAPSDAGPDSSVKDASVADATTPTTDASTPVTPVTPGDPPNDEGSLEGGGIGCSVSEASHASAGSFLVALGALGAALVARRRKRA